MLSPKLQRELENSILVSIVPLLAQHKHGLLAVGLSHSGWKERDKLFTQARNVHNFIWFNGMS